MYVCRSLMLAQIIRICPDIQGVSKKVSLVDCWSYQSFVTFKKVSLTHSISSDGLENFFIYPSWVKQNCKNFSGQNTVWNMVKIHFEKYQNSKKSKILRFVAFALQPL